MQKGHTKKNLDPALRKHYIGQLVDALLLPDTEQHSEDPLWKVVETTDPEEEEKPYWAEVEGGWSQAVRGGYEWGKHWSLFFKFILIYLLVN